MIVKRTYLLKVDNNEQKNILLIPILSLHSLSYNRHVFFKRPQTQVKIQKFFLYYNRKWVFILGAEINHVLVVNHQKYDVKLQEKSILQNVHYIRVFIFLNIIIYILYIYYLFFTSFNAQNEAHVSLVQSTQNLPKFTMTQKAYFHALKCTFNPNPIWDQKWNYMDPYYRVINVTLL